MVDAMGSTTFKANLISTMLINFGINFGLEWATLSNWGRVHKQDFLPLYVSKWTHVQRGGSNTCIALDVPLTSYVDLGRRPGGP